MMRNQIAHTLAIFKSKPFNYKSDSLTVKAVIFPRKSREGIIKINQKTFIIMLKFYIILDIVPNEKNVLFALCELSGHFVVPSNFYEKNSFVYIKLCKI